MKTDAIIYVQVPHTSEVQLFTFSNQAEFLQSLRDQAPAGFSFQKFTRSEFEEATREESTGHEVGSDWWNKWVKPGMDMFEDGAQTIAEVWRNETNQEFLFNPTDREEFDALFAAVDDYHAHYYLRHDEAVATLKRGKTFHDHQGYATLRKIEQAADALGWWYAEEEAEA
jgi:hypothetical protein